VSRKVAAGRNSHQDEERHPNRDARAENEFTADHRFACSGALGVAVGII